MSKLVLYRLVWIPSFLLVIFVLTTFSRPSARSDTPGKLKLYAALDRSVMILRPENWTVRETDEHSFKNIIRIESDKYTYLTISADSTSSLLAAIDNAPGATGDRMREITGAGINPLQKLHLAKGTDLETLKRYHYYTEGSTTGVQIAGMDAFVTDFTYKELLLSGWKKMSGIRATLITGDRRIQLIGHCPRESEKVIMPVLNKMILSLQVVQSGGKP